MVRYNVLIIPAPLPWGGGKCYGVRGPVPNPPVPNPSGVRFR